MAGARWLAATAWVGLLAAGCAGERETAAGLRPTRGVVLISLGNVGAGRLGASGSSRPTSPFFDRLAERGVLFEHAVTPSTATLTANASLFTGLYPQQHGVYPPDKALSGRVETLSERFSFFGYRTAGFTDGGFVGRHFGFHRGFDHFDDAPGGHGDGATDTFSRALDFLGGLGPREPFFLFVRSGAAAAPYAPPTPDGGVGSPPAPTPRFAPTGVNLRRADRGFLVADDATARHFSLLHDAVISHLDGLLESFFTELDRLGLAAETTVVVTSDHGEEFLEHGGLGHYQVYPETIRVPLLVLHPGLGGARIPGLAQLVDVAPTLYELADLPPSAATSGRSLVPRLLGHRPEQTWAYAEARAGRRQRSLLRHRDGAVHQLVVTTLPGERDGTWMARRAALELAGGEELAVVSFHRERALRLRVDGGAWAAAAIGTAWTPLDPGLPADGRRHRLDLVADGCESPRELGLSHDPRCLSFKLRGVEVRLSELFDLAADPAARRDLAAARPDVRRELETRLADLEWSIVTPAANRPPTAGTAEILRAAGYLD